MPSTAAEPDTDGQDVLSVVRSRDKNAIRSDTVPVPVPPAGTRIDSVLATVNGEPITMLDVILETGSREKELAEQGGSMPLTEHFREMRNRLAVVLGAFVLFNVVLIARAQVLVGFLTDMGAAYGYQFIYISPSELLLQQFKAALTASFVLCIPLLLYNVSR